GLLLPAVQKVREASVKVRNSRIYGTLSEDMLKVADTVEAHAKGLRKIMGGINSDGDGDAVSNDTLNNYANAFSQDETNIANVQASVATLRSKRPCDRNLDDVESALLDAH